MQVDDKTLHTYVADFGLGKVLMETRALGTATKIAGTPGFQAPEKLRGEALTTAVDVYSLGGVLTELFSGKPLYEKMDPHIIIYKVAVQDIMPDFRNLPDSIFRIVQRCLCPLEDRISSVHVLELLLNI